MISGRNRIMSAELKTGLAGTAHLDGGAAMQFDAEWNVYLRLIEHARGHFPNGRQEGLRVDSHPDHHRDQRYDHGPLPQVQIGHVRSKLFARLAVKDPL